MVPPNPADEPTFAQVATDKFDALRANSQVFWESSVPEHVSHNGFKFEFRIVPAFSSKPLPPRGGGNRPAQNKDPFTNPEEGFVVLDAAQLQPSPSHAPTHVLQFNKFCVYRPQFILHTAEFAKQTDDLDGDDFAAGLGVLRRLGGKRRGGGEGRLGTGMNEKKMGWEDRANSDWVLFFNCGLRAGSSQGHKHLQIVPKPLPEDFVLFPDRMVMDGGGGGGSGGGSLAIAQPSRPPARLCVPYDCLVVRLDREATADDIYSMYEGMLMELRKTTRVMSGERVSGAHNMIMTLNWMCVIPRQSRGDDGIYTNAMGMIGLVWVKDQAEREGWDKLRLTDELRAMGSPPLLQLP